MDDNTKGLGWDGMIINPYYIIPINPFQFLLIPMNPYSSHYLGDEETPHSLQAMRRVESFIPRQPLNKKAMGRAVENGLHLVMIVDFYNQACTWYTYDYIHGLADGTSANSL